MNGNQGKPASSCAYPSVMVSQTPKFDKGVWSRKAKIWRPTKKRRKVKFL